jgi:hypothetical protein
MFYSHLSINWILNEKYIFNKLYLIKVNHSLANFHFILGLISNFFDIYDKII